MFDLTLKFENTEDLQDFLEDYNQIQNKKLRPKKENDRRGSKTKEFHEAVKLYHLEHPEKSYLDCLKEYKDENKNV
jgi:hypothetical protein